ncbi:hypothetical protein E4T46_05208, partial [Aureobasidium subglaciale]
AFLTLCAIFSISIPTPHPWQQDTANVKNTSVAWDKWLPISFWVLQIIVCGVAVAFGAFAINTIRVFMDTLLTYSGVVALGVGAGLSIAWAVVSFILVIAEIIVFVRWELNPYFAMMPYSIKTGLWLILFLVEIHELVVAHRGAVSPIVSGIFL